MARRTTTAKLPLVHPGEGLLADFLEGWGCRSTG